MNKTESVRGMIEGYGRSADEVGRGFCEDENARVRLAAIRLQPQIADGEFTGERFGGNSMVVRVSNGKVELPPEAAGLFPALTAEMVTSEYEQTGTEIASDSGSDTDGAQNQVLLTSGRIGGDWYFVRWTSVEEYDAYIRSHLSADTLAETVESVNDIELFIIRSDPDSERRKVPPFCIRQRGCQNTARWMNWASRGKIWTQKSSRCAQKTAKSISASL